MDKWIAIFDQKNIKIFSSVNVFKFLVNETLDPKMDPQLEKMVVPYPH
jgi:hypothetical protein